MKHKKILVVYKKSTYHDLILAKKDPHYLKLLKKKDMTVRRIYGAHVDHKRTLRKVLQVLKATGAKVDSCLRNRPRKGSYDLIVTVGGDGTLLAASHLAGKTPVLGVNSMPKTSHGYYCAATEETFERKLKALMKGRARLLKFPRLQLIMRGKRIGPPALNDILFCNLNPAATTRYYLKIGVLQEQQRSSGIWFATPTGSTAATLAAGGRKISLIQKTFQYVVREPMVTGEPRYALKKGTVGARTEITVIVAMENGVFFIDGPHERHPIRRGERAKIRLGAPLLLVC